jgi:regulator of sirC expression with transglutaminase-like and TPR domain
MSQADFNTLISLLDDPNAEVYVPVTNQLLEHGTDVIPDLEKAWESSYDEKLQERIENIIQKIQFGATKDNLRRWLKEGAINILEGAYFLAQYQYPEIEFKLIDQKIEKITKDVWLEINNNLTALEKVKIINHILFEHHGFGRNSVNYYAPQNNFVNQVLESKKGNPIMLSIIYMETANRLGLPIYGVNLPKNFILAYVDDYRDYQVPSTDDDILFYINPFNKGAVLGKREIEYFLKNQNITPDDSCFKACSNKVIIQRLINNLIVSYERDEAHHKVEQLREFLSLFE